MFAARSHSSNRSRLHLVAIDRAGVPRARMDMNMSPYRSIANTVGSREALELAQRLAAWHDAMVVHQRRAARIRAVCEDDCPHADAETLWSEALELYGERAHELRFLRTHGVRPRHQTKRRVVEVRF
jgi:hypothetical protein